MLLRHPGMKRIGCQSGTTLVEAVIAIGLLAGAVTALAGRAHSAIRAATLARERTIEPVCALEQIEGLCRDVRLLAVSPDGTLTADVPGFVEYLDARGAVATRANRVFVRRWSVAPVRADPDLLAIQVAVAACRGAGSAGPCEAASGVRFASIRSRLAW